MSVLYHSKNRSGEPVEQQYARVSARRLKGWLIAVATSACASGAIVGGTGLAASPDEDKKPIGIILLFAGAALGIGGGSYSALRIARDTGALKEIQAKMNLSTEAQDKGFKKAPREKIYQKDKDTGLYETYGDALDRVKTRQVVNGMVGLMTTVGGGLSFVEALSNFHHPALSMVMARATNDLASGRSLAFITEALVLPMVAGVVAAYTFNKAAKADKIIPVIEADVAYYGSNGRIIKLEKSGAPSVNGSAEITAQPL